MFRETNFVNVRVDGGGPKTTQLIDFNDCLQVTTSSVLRPRFWEIFSLGQKKSCWNWNMMMILGKSIVFVVVVSLKQIYLNIYSNSHLDTPCCKSHSNETWTTHFFCCKDVARTEGGTGAMFISYSDRLIHRWETPWDVMLGHLTLHGRIDQLLQEILENHHILDGKIWILNRLKWRSYPYKTVSFSTTAF